MTTRRLFLGLLPAAYFTPARAAEEHPCVTFMGRVGTELLHAHRQGTVPAFMRVIQRYADVENISGESIGSYVVPSDKLATYQRGVATFISRYMADQSRNFPVAKFEIGGATVDTDKNVLVNSKVYMMAGQTYNVTWKLSWVNGSYKVADVHFFGLSMAGQEKSLFSSYIAKHDGDVNALIAALNR